MSLLRDERGAVFLEFLVAFVPLWVFFLCMVQLGFISNANLLVKHAADSAARSAMVVLPDDPAQYADEEERRVEGGAIDGGAITSTLGEFASAIYGAAIGSTSVGDAMGSMLDSMSELAGDAVSSLFGSRGNTIKVAAHIPLVPLAPADYIDSDPSIKNSLATGGSALKSLVYNPFAVTVNFPDAEDDRIETQEARVVVNYRYRCSVPVARKIICGDKLEGTFASLVGSLIGGRYKEIEHESTLLIHDAPYNYKEEE